jgi:hypothetical protein
VDGVVWDTYHGAGRDVMGIDFETTGEDFTREDTADRWRETHAFVDYGAQVVAGVEFWAGVDLFYVVEFGTDFFAEFGEGGGVVNEVEECAGEGCGGGVASGDDEEIAFTPEFWTCEALAGFWIAGVEEVVEEVFAVCVESYLLTFGGLSFGVCHVLHSHVIDLAEKHLVQSEGLDGGIRTKLFSQSLLQILGELTYNQMHMRRIPDQINHMSIILPLQHLKRLPKTQIPHDIKRQIIRPISHILRNTPPLLPNPLTQSRRKSAYIP